MKRLYKITLSFITAVCLGILSPLTTYAFNSNYSGTFYCMSNQRAFIDFNSSGCTANIVYSPLESQYIRATGNTGYLDSSHFYASFSNYRIVDNQGGVIRYVNSETHLEGDVDVGSNYIDIIIGGIIYEKGL